ncbi:sigma-70 family RNA polymerase sigma factor [Psychrobacillus sp. INOP01]|uniref:sigma-70 family RNA polymerase sigma factor n=1 Tax=Psychrobacillus sp. INOP01 TaxID=2829187 RepID=UPI001BAA2AEB|nr:sigma-70 family RNA polymerase sigma factor [Psychrobacillus sp. INOP01]QUG40028.1 sigma-70 family RNA polymerase sigma factor [Psychrobacillus sp. INOP01]
MNRFLTEQQFQQVMKEYTDYLLKLAYLYIKDWSAAEDIVQDVFLTYYQKAEQFEERSSLKTYLAKITINKCKDYLKSWRYRKQVLTNNFFNPSKKGRDRIIEEDERLELADAVFQLPVKYREVIIYYYFEELSVLEISQLLSIPDNTVKTRLRKARALLKVQLKENDWEVLIHE